MTPAVDFEKTVAALRRRNAHGEQIEALLAPIEADVEQALPVVGEVVADASEPRWLRLVLLSGLTRSAEPVVVPLLARLLQDVDGDVVDRATSALRRIDTRESRTILWRYEQRR